MGTKQASVSSCNSTGRTSPSCRVSAHTGERGQAQGDGGHRAGSGTPGAHSLSKAGAVRPSADVLKSHLVGCTPCAHRAAGCPYPSTRPLPAGWSRGPPPCSPGSQCGAALLCERLRANQGLHTSQRCAWGPLVSLWLWRRAPAPDTSPVGQPLARPLSLAASPTKTDAAEGPPHLHCP